MHEDLLRLQALARLDAERDAVLAALREREAAVDEARRALEEHEPLVEAARAELDALRQRERATSRDLAERTRRRDDTRRLIDEGRAPDYTIAQRQLDQLDALVDRLETELLELMEARDEAAERLGAAERGLGLRRLARERARERLAEERPRLEAEATRLAAAVAEAREDLPPGILERYDALRRRGRRPLAHVRDGHCSACQVRIGALVLAEHRRGTGVQNCTNCGRFLVDEPAGEAG